MPNTLHLRSPQRVRIESRKSHTRLKVMRDAVVYVNTNDLLINDRCEHEPPSVPDSISRDGWPQRIGEGHSGRSSKPPTGLGSGVACGELEAGPNARELVQWDRVHSAVDSAAGHRPKAAAPRVIETRRPLNPPRDLQEVEPTLRKNLEHNFSMKRIFTRCNFPRPRSGSALRLICGGTWGRDSRPCETGQRGQVLSSLGFRRGASPGGGSAKNDPGAVPVWPFNRERVEAREGSDFDGRQKLEHIGGSEIKPISPILFNYSIEDRPGGRNRRPLGPERRRTR